MMGDRPTIPTAALVDWITRFSLAVDEHADELNALDAAIGDADHGANLRRGCRAVMDRLAAVPPADGSAFAKDVSMELINAVGGASGVLYGSFFLAFNASVQGATELDLDSLTRAWRAGVDNVQRRGRAEISDKTMLDALLPAVESLETAAASRATFATAFGAAESAAQKGAEATVSLLARRGRASYLGERSIGHADPGARSSWLLVRAASHAFGEWS